jgi:hypothetical protein
MRTCICGSAEACRRRVLYVGDGTGDICAAKALQKGDVVCPREGFPLARAVGPEAEGEDKDSMHASVRLWKEGEDLAILLRSLAELP